MFSASHNSVIKRAIPPLPDTIISGISCYQPVDLQEGRKALQRDLYRLDQRAEDNGMRFSKVKYWVLPLDHNSRQCYRLGEGWLESCSAVRVLGVLVSSQLDMSSMCPDGQDGPWHPGLDQHTCGQHNQGSDCPIIRALVRGHLKPYVQF